MDNLRSIIRVVLHHCSTRVQYYVSCTLYTTLGTLYCTEYPGILYSRKMGRAKASHCARHARGGVLRKSRHGSLLFMIFDRRDAAPPLLLVIPKPPHNHSNSPWVSTLI
jgi:hypothetical protein